MLNAKMYAQVLYCMCSMPPKKQYKSNGAKLYVKYWRNWPLAFISQIFSKENEAILMQRIA